MLLHRGKRLRQLRRPRWSVLWPDRPAEKPGWTGQPAVGTDLAGLTAWIAAAGLRPAADECRWIDDDLDRADAPGRGTRDQLAPDTIERVLREHLWSLRADADPADDPHLLPDTRKRHAGVDSAAAASLDGSHLRIAGPPEGGLVPARGLLDTTNARSNKPAVHARRLDVELRPNRGPRTGEVGAASAWDDRSDGMALGAPDMASA